MLHQDRARSRSHGARNLAGAQEKLEEAKAVLEAEGATVKTASMDVTQEAEWKAAVDSTVSVSATPAECLWLLRGNC